MRSPKPLADRVALVTGASRGLGRVIAERLADDGAYVVVGFRRREDEAKRTLELVRARGADGELAAFDVSHEDEVQAAFDRIAKTRTIDIVVNNAGVVDDQAFALTDRESWMRVMRVDLDGTYHVSRAAVASMIRQKRGSIVNIASAAVTRALPNQTSYVTAKGGVVAFTRALAAELGPHGVRVNAVLPGVLTTGMGTRVPHDVLDRLRDVIPMHRFGAPEDVANVVALLASDAATYMTGQAIVIDGGLSL